MAGSVNFNLLRQRLEQIEALTQLVQTAGTATQPSAADSNKDSPEQLSMDLSPQPAAPSSTPVAPPAAAPIAPVEETPSLTPVVTAASSPDGLRMNAKQMRRALIFSEILAPPVSRRK